MISFEQLLLAILGSSLLASIFGNLVIELYRTHTRKTERKYTQLEERCFSLLTNVIGLRRGYYDIEAADKFNEAYRQLWLYAPDNVILAINNFINLIRQKDLYKTHVDTERERAFGNMVLTIRKYYYGKTKLTAENFLLILIPRTTEEGAN